MNHDKLKSISVKWYFEKTKKKPKEQTSKENVSSIQKVSNKSVMNQVFLGGIIWKLILSLLVSRFNGHDLIPLRVLIFEMFPFTEEPKNF